MVKFVVMPDHLDHIIKAFEQMRKHKLKMNSLKHAFGVQVRNFLGFLVHQQGIEVDRNKAKAIIEAWPSKTKKELQWLFNQINFQRWFIFNTAR